ncbi:MAG: hypothetical protein ACXVVQ_16775 [Solirubrobacteraceae bacterium]
MLTLVFGDRRDAMPPDGRQRRRWLAGATFETHAVPLPTVRAVSIGTGDARLGMAVVERARHQPARARRRAARTAGGW